MNVGVDLLINLASTFDSIPLAVEFMIGIISCRCVLIYLYGTGTVVSVALILNVLSVGFTRNASTSIVFSYCFLKYESTVNVFVLVASRYESTVNAFSVTFLINESTVNVSANSFLTNASTINDFVFSCSMNASTVTLND